MIRHALYSGTVTAISFGVHGATTGSCLIASSGYPLPVAAGLLRAGFNAIDLASIAPPTDKNLRAAATTQKHPARNFVSTCATAYPTYRMPVHCVGQFQQIFSAPLAGTCCWSTEACPTISAVRSPSTLDASLAGRAATVKAGLRPPPSAAVGLDSGSPPSRRCSPSVRRIEAAGCSLVERFRRHLGDAAKKARISTVVHSTRNNGHNLTIAHAAAYPYASRARWHLEVEFAPARDIVRPWLMSYFGTRA